MNRQYRRMLGRVRKVFRRPMAPAERARYIAAIEEREAALGKRNGAISNLYGQMKAGQKFVKEMEGLLGIDPGKKYTWKGRREAVKGAVRALLLEYGDE